MLLDYEQALVRYAFGITGDLDTARDVVQDAFLKLCRANRAKVRDHMPAWLYRVCRNRALDVRKKEGRNQPLHEEQLTRLPGEAPGPSAQAEREENHRLVLAVLNELPADQREACRLKFNDDTKDAGEIGAGHTVTALYEIVPAEREIDLPDVDPLKYQRPAGTAGAAASGELLTLKLRYKEPDGDNSRLLEFPVIDTGRTFADVDADFAFAVAVASFGMLLRDSEHRGNATFSSVLDLAEEGRGEDPRGYRAEFIDLVKKPPLWAGNQ